MVKLVNKSHDNHWSCHMTKEKFNSKDGKKTHRLGKKILLPQQVEVEKCSLFSVSLPTCSNFSL